MTCAGSNLPLLVWGVACNESSRNLATRRVGGSAMGSLIDASQRVVEGEPPSKRVLLIAQYFPPAGGVGTHRVTKFVKFLPQAGWDPIILSIRPESYPPFIRHDESMLADIPPSASLIRTAYLQRRWLLDDGVRWFPTMLPAAIRLVRRAAPDVCFLSGGPFFPLVAGPLLKTLLGLPYVVDLRDPWRLAEHRGRSTGVRSYLSKLASELLEPPVVRRAANVICVSQPMRDRYAAAYPDLADDHFQVIPNGFDPDDFDSLAAWSYDRFTIVFAGKFRYREAVRNPRPFFRALKQVVQVHPQVTFVHIGIEEQEVREAAKDEGVHDHVVFTGPKPYAETLRRIKGADLALLIGGGLLTEQSAKIFDYLGCKRPILALAPAGGGIADVLAATGAGWLIEPDNQKAIFRQLLLCVRGEASLEIVPSGRARYQRSQLARELASLLDKAHGEGGART